MDGTYITKEREKRGLTQQELANLADVSLHTVFRAEKGKNVQIDSLQKIAEALDLSVSALVNEGDLSAELTDRDEIENQTKRKTIKTCRDEIIFEYIREKETLRLIFPSSLPVRDMEERVVILLKGAFGTER